MAAVAPLQVETQHFGRLAHAVDAAARSGIAAALRAAQGQRLAGDHAGDIVARMKEYSSIIQAMICGVVYTSGAGTSTSGR
jgi:hypothetical protein